MNVVIFPPNVNLKAELRRLWQRNYAIRGGAFSGFPAGPINIGAPFLWETPPLALPQTDVKTIFTAQGLQYQGGPGMLRITDIFGQITTVIGAVANATKLKVVSTDNAGTALTAVDLCATLDINAKPKGGSLSITGTLANAMTENDNGVQIAQVTPIHVTFGTTALVQVDCAGSDGGTGRIKWFMLGAVSYGVNVIPTVS